jgi:hypothetical protein
MSLGVAVRLAQFIEKLPEPRDDPAMTLDLAGPSAFFGVIGELALKAEAFRSRGAYWEVVMNLAQVR